MHLLPSEHIRKHLERENRIVYIPQRMKLFLFLFSLVHRSGCLIKNWLHKKKILKPKKAPLPVISVGNITFGGTEKTPLVINLISFLFKNGFKTALISRGYKGKWEKKGGILSDGKNITGTVDDSGDEPLMVARNIPQAGIFIGKNRLLSCQRAKDSGFEIVVLDDGFQHRRLHRDLDIVLYDPAEKTALREPASSLKRANVLLMKRGVDLQKKKEMRKRFPESSIYEYSVQSQGLFSLGEKERKQAEYFKGKKVLALSGIARPERFLSILQDLGIKPVFFFKFPDHYPFPPSSLEKITRKFHQLRAEAIIITEKDAVKIIHDRGFKNIPIYYLKINLKLEEEFYPKISHLLQNRA